MKKNLVGAGIPDLNPAIEFIVSEKVFLKWVVGAGGVWGQMVLKQSSPFSSTSSVSIALKSLVNDIIMPEVG